MSAEIVADAARSPRLAEGMSKGQARTTGTRHQAARTAGLLRDRSRMRGATTAQPYATVNARSSGPALLIGRDLVHRMAHNSARKGVGPRPAGPKKGPNGPPQDLHFRGA